MFWSRLFLIALVSFPGGVFLNSMLPFNQFSSLAFFVFGAGLVFFSLRKRRFALLGICFVFVALGMGRYQEALFRAKHNELALANDRGQAISFVARVVEEPDVRWKHTRLVVKPEGVSGRVLLTTDRFYPYEYGERLRIAGKLETPISFGEFDYQEYLLKDGIYSLMKWPKIEVLEREGYGGIIPAVRSKIFAVKNRMREVLFDSIPSPENAIGAALLLGDQSRLSEERKEKLNITGTRHIVAISGQHIVVLTNMFMAFLLGIGCWRRQAIGLAALSMILFIALTGAESSAVRAGIMGGIALLGQWLGRTNASLRGLVIAGSLMIAFNPLLLSRDIGFQLSFLASLGIIVSFSFFQRMLRKFRFLDAFLIRDILAANFSAQAFTVPLILYNFGYVSLVSLLTNILLLPFIPFLLGIGFLFLLGGAVWGFLANLLVLPTFLLLHYFVLVVDLFAYFPFASFGWKEVPPVFVVFLYLAGGLFFWRVWKQERFPFLSGDILKEEKI